uniref:Leucine rich repeat kinase 2 n=1 Tax=Falco tinnunculus TaxID=100819 RepID=A0A8C4XLR4_FALTI
MASAGPREGEAAAAREEQALRKLVVRLRNVQERERLETLVQTLSDLLELATRQSAPRLFGGQNVHVPLLLVVDLYPGAAGVQQVRMGWSLLCKLIEICPSTLQSIAPKDVGKDWEVLGVHQQILKMLTIHKGNINLSVIGLKALNLLLMSGIECFTFLLCLKEEVDVFSLVFNAMHSFPKNEEIQQHGCKVLHKLFEKVPEEQLTEFVESKDHMIILKVFKEFPEKEEVILPALYSLHSLAGPRNNVEVLMSGNVRCYNVIVEMMKSFPSSETVQEVSCCLLHKLTLGNFFNILVLHKIPEVIVKAVKTYPENGKLQAAALSCLALLTETIFLNRDLEERKEEEEEEKLCWLEACYRALELHRKNTDVLEAACWALKNLFLYQRNLHEKIGDGDNQFPIDRAVMLSMLMHSSSKEVFQAAASTLAILSQQNVSIRKTLLGKGIHMNVLDIMRKHPHSPEVAESSCRILNCVFEGSFPHLDVMTVAVSEVVKAMRKHEKSLSVQLEALRVLLHFMMPGKSSKNIIVIKSQCLLEGTHSLVLNALNRFIGNPSIQKRGLKLLASLAECTGALEILTQQGATDTVLHTLQMYPDKQDIQCLGLSLLRSLITRKILCIATMHVLSTVLVSTLRRFKEVTEIQMHGFHAILSVLGLSPCFAKLLVHESFDAVIFYQMSMCFTDQRDRQFQSLCCKCFAKIAENDDLKNVMLEKACIENNSIMAECLLLLGADINKKTKTNSLIYQVCEKGHNPKLVELLLANGAREQDVRSALTISIKRGDSQIISLLLKKLSLDVANSSICLGGFGIGRLEPSWLIPLFPDKLTPLRKQNAGSALARMVLKFQMKNISEDRSRASSDLNFCEDGVDKNYDWSFISDPLVDSVFPLSDDIDSEGSEGSLFTKKKSNSIAVADFHCREMAFQRSSPTLPRHSYSVGPGSDYEPLMKQRRKFFPSDESPSEFSPHIRPSDSLSSLISEKEYIKSLDLSSNELENIDAISQNSCLTSHLEHLEKLELHQNALTSIPEQLCENLKCLTYLDLHSNKFTSFPTYLLKMSCIASLDISRNDIGPSFALDPCLKCPTLKQLNLSYNQLVCTPEFLTNVAENLEQLLLEGNKISCLCSPICLKELKVLNISKNSISSLAENVFMDCTKLEQFNARMNALEIIPDLSSSITNLKLSQNRFINVPEAILLLPHLRSVDLSQNKIISLPGPMHWKSLNLRELLFNHNQIDVLDLSEKACAWSRLEKLHLSHNKLKEVNSVGILLYYTLL